MEILQIILDNLQVAGPLVMGVLLFVFYVLRVRKSQLELAKLQLEIFTLKEKSKSENSSIIKPTAEEVIRYSKSNLSNSSKNTFFSIVPLISIGLIFSSTFSLITSNEHLASNLTDAEFRASEALIRASIESNKFSAYSSETMKYKSLIKIIQKYEKKVLLLESKLRENGIESIDDTSCSTSILGIKQFIGQNRATFVERLKASNVGCAASCHVEIVKGKIKLYAEEEIILIPELVIRELTCKPVRIK